MKAQLLIVATILISYSTPTSAESKHASPAQAEAQCTDLLLQCLKGEGMSRSNCLFSSATHPFCDGTELGSLAYRRWALTPIDSRGASAPSFLGPQIIDRECVARFDAELKKTLSTAAPSADSIRQLTASLEECRRDIGMEMQRQ